MRFDTAIIMMREATKQSPASASAFYLYVSDARASMELLCTPGAEKIMDVNDMPFGDRQGGVRDLASNIWWVSRRLTDAPYF